MSKNNFATAEPTKKEEAEDEYIPLTFRRFVRQKAGLRAVRQRKRREKRALNKIVHTPKRAKKAMKKHGVSDKIQRGFDTAKRWRIDEMLEVMKKEKKDERKKNSNDVETGA